MDLYSGFPNVLLRIFLVRSGVMCIVSLSEWSMMEKVGFVGSMITVIPVFRLSYMAILVPSYVNA